MMIKLLCAAAWLCLPQVQDSLESFVRFLESPDAEVREWARGRLLEQAEKAGPLLEARLREKGAYATHVLLDEIQKGLTPNRWMSDAVMKEAVKPDGSYLRTKFEEAYGRFARSEYREAMRLVDAMLTLEPGGPLARDLRVFLVGCQQRILETEVVALRASADLPRAAVGTKIDLDFRLTNIGPDDLKIDFGAGKGVMVVDLRVTMRDPLGGERIIVRALTAELNSPITIPPGESHTITVEFDTEDDLPDRDAIRLYEAHGWFQPMAINSGTLSTPARVIFKRVTVRVVPKSRERFLDDPMFSFRQALDQGNTNDVFIAGLLLEGEKRDEAVGLLIALLPETNQRGRIISGYLLGFMTGKRFGMDVKGWRNWWESRKTSKN